MRNATPLVATLAVLALAVGALLLVLDDGQEPVDPFALTPRPEDEPAPQALPLPGDLDAPGARLNRPDHPPLAAGGSDTAADPDAPAATRLHGQLSLRGGDAPPAGLGLRLTWYPRSADGQEGPPEQVEPRSDEQGRYAVSLPLEGPARLARAEVVDGGDVPDQRVTIGLLLEPGEDLRHDLTLEAGVILAGEVRDPTGRPVPSAQVHGWSGSVHRLRQDQLDRPQRTTLSDAAGRFRLAGVGPRWVLAAEAEGRTGRHRLFGLHPSGTVLEGLVLELSSTRDLAVQVLGPDGAPLPDARVRVRAPLSASGERLTDQPDVYRGGPGTHEAWTGRDGRCRITGLVDRSVQVTITHDDHPDWTGEHAPADGDLQVRMVGGLDLSGLVLGADGRPLEGARLRLRSLEVPSNDGETTSDAQGRFRFGGLAPDADGWLAVLAAGHAVHVVQPLRIAAGLPPRRVELVPQWTLAGQVVDVAGAPVAGAAVSIEGDRVVDLGDVSMTPTPTWERCFALDDAVTDDQGRFTFLGLYDGSFRIEASAPDRGPRTAARARSGQEQLVLVLDPEAVVGVTFTGRAFDTSTGQPLGAFEVTPMLPDGGGGLGGTSQSFEDDQGRYRIPGLEPGPVLLMATAPGYAPWSSELVEYLAGEHVVDLPLSPVRHVELQVVDVDGVPQQVRLSFSDPSGEGLMVSSGPGTRNTHLRTDETGRVLASGLPAERIGVSVEGPGAGQQQTFQVDLRQQPGDAVQLVLSPRSGDG